MDTLHTVMRSIRGETKSRRDHTSVFREFLDHLGRIGRTRTPRAGSLRADANGKGNGAPGKGGVRKGRR